MAINVKVKKRYPVALILACCAYTAPWEGVKTHAYRDIGGVPTICYGETQGVKVGEVKTLAECQAMLRDRMPDYIGKVDAILPGLPDNRLIAYTDASYNLGTGVLTLRTLRNGEPQIGTSIVDLERKGDWQAACERLGTFDKVCHKLPDGRKECQVVTGLEHRRDAEVKTCLNG